MAGTQPNIIYDTMKRKFYIIYALAIIAGAAGCSDKMVFRTGSVSPVESLITPEDGTYIELQSSSSATTEFRWSPAYAEDGNPPQYEVVFYSEPDGEIVYRVDAGFSTSAGIPHKELNSAARAAGIETGADGTMYWAVVASRGITQSEVTVTPYSLEVTRLLGFEEIPEALYITGAGSEGGDDISAACKAINGTEEGTFIFYHQLKAGQGFTFIDSMDESHKTYTVTDGILDDQSTVPATVAEDGLYRIALDFNIRSITFEPVTNVIFNFADSFETAMTYIGNGMWKLTGYSVAFIDHGSWEEDRYNFRAMVDGTEMLWGYEAGDSSRPGSLTGSYFYVYEYVYDGNRWQNPYKFADSVNGSTVDITLYMNGDMDHPTHIIDNIR